MTDPTRHSTALLILGVHRSGTSSLTGVLHLLGVELGARLLAPHKDINERGFWEQSDIVALHNRLLDSLGSRWDSMYPLPQNWWQSSEVEPVRQAIRDTLRQEFGTAGLWGVKDPRLCRLLPLWLNILEQLSCQPAFVIIYRHPLEVADSLSRRDHMETSQALNLWLQNMLDAEYYSRTGPRTWVAYRELLDDWRTSFRRIAGDLALQWPRDIDAVEDEIDRFLEPALRHHCHKDEDLQAPGLSPWVGELYAALQAYGDSGDGGLIERFDVVRREFELAIPLFGPVLKSEEKQFRDLESSYIRAEEANRGFTQAVEMLKARDEELARANALLTPGVRALAKALGEWPDEEPPAARAVPDTHDDKVYGGGIDLRVSNNASTRLFNFIREDSGGQRSRILEVGCSSGYFGQALKDAGHEVWGVELSPKAAARAPQRLDHVFVGTVEDFLALDSLRGVKFDYITFGDVLEHLVDPERVLRDCRRILSPAGAIAASIPNIAHKAVRMMLLQGRWDYADFGILDSANLRFFTRDSIVDTFTRAGYGIHRMDIVVLEAEQTGIRFDSGLLERTAGLIKDDDQDVFQYDVLARRAEASQDLPAGNARFKGSAPPHILCLLPMTDWTVGDIRIRNPLEKFRQQYGGQLRIRNLFEPWQEDLDWADTVVLQRESNKYVLELLDSLQKLGKRIVIDMDDLLTEVPPFLQCYDHSAQVRPYLQEALRMVDAVTVTTGRLREEMRAYNPNVFIVPNCVYSVHQPARHDPDAPAGVTLLVASSDTVRVDFIVPVLKRLLADSQLKLRLVGIGPPGRFLHEAGLEVEMHPNMAYEDFKAYLSSLDDTIGIVPLDDSRFSACKSPVKYLDLALAGIPAVCSDVPPYQDVVRDEETGLLCADREEDWYQAVRKLALSADLRTDIAQAARRFCERNYSMAHAADCWHEVFTQVEPGQGRSGSAWLKDLAGPHILCLLPVTDWAIGDIRIRNPLEKFRQHYGGEVRIGNVFEASQEDLDWADTVILQRNADKSVLARIDRLQKLGKRIVIDMDDLLTEVPPFLLRHAESAQLRPYLQEALRMVDAVTVTTGRLREEMQAYNSNVFIVPNCVHSVHQPARHYPDAQAGVTLLVASSDTVRVDFIVPVLRRLLADPQLNLRLVGIGPPGRFLHEAGLEVEMHPNMAYEDFKAYLSSLDNTIGIVPLDDSRFSACKSPVKYLDFALAGIPAVCSDVPPYQDVVRDEETGFLCADREEDWYQAVRTLALSADLRTDIARAARRFCERNYSMAHAADCWHEVFTQVEPGQGGPGSALLTGWHHAPLLLQHITNPASYRTALRVLRTEGLRGIKARLTRVL